MERARCEDFRVEKRVETVTLRAVGIPLQAVAHLVAPEGEVLIFGGQPQVSAPFETVRTLPLARSELFVVRAAIRNVSRET